MDERSARRARIAANAFEALVAFACIVTAAAFFLEPHFLERAPIGQALPAIRYLWVSLLVASSAAILSGLWSGRARREAAGLVLLAVVGALQSVALLAVARAQGITSMAMFIAIAWACLARVRILMKAPRDIQSRR